MIDLDLVDVGSKLTITTDGDAIKTKVEFVATHNADNGWAVSLMARREETEEFHAVSVEAAIDRKAAKMIVNYLQTIYE